MADTPSVLRPEHLQKIIVRDGAPHCITEFDPKTTALVVVDMQNFYLADGAPSYCADARAIVPAVNR